MLEQIARERVLLKKIREKCSKTSQHGVSIITSTNKPNYANNIFNNYTRFSYPYKELIIILNNNRLNISDYEIKAKDLPTVQIFQLDENCTLGECLNFGIEHSKYDYISKMDDDDYYGNNYLTDLMNVFKYTDAKVTGKSTCFMYFKDKNALSLYLPNHENKYVTGGIAGGTITFKKEIYQNIRFRHLKTDGEDTNFLKDCNSANIRIFSADKYNYVYIRNKDLNDHTWKISSEELISYYSDKLLLTTNFYPIVTV